MNIYRRALRLRASDVDMHRRLRLSVLFGLMQEAAVAHTEALGMGRERTLDRGVLWVVTLQRAEIARMPVYDEDIVLRSWPGRTMHVLFPRYCALDTADGEPLVRACSLWTLVDAASRRLAFPEAYGVALPCVETGDEVAIPAAPRAVPCDSARDFVVPYSYVDLNGHMNNTRYFDLAEDTLPAAAEGRALRAVDAEFCREARLGDRLALRAGGEDGRFYIAGAHDGRDVFRMSLTYEGG